MPEVVCGASNRDSSSRCEVTKMPLLATCLSIVSRLSFLAAKDDSLLQINAAHYCLRMQKPVQWGNMAAASFIGKACWTAK